MENLADSTKEKVIEALAAQEKCSRRLRECLGVQIKGIGILSSSAVRSAEADWQQALEEVEAITSRTVRPENLLAEMDQAENVTITRGR
jgi:hypothetical protein